MLLYKHGAENLGLGFLFPSVLLAVVQLWGTEVQMEILLSHSVLQCSLGRLQVLQLAVTSSTPSPHTVFFFPMIFASAPFQLMALAEIVFLRPNLETELLTQHFSLCFLEEYPTLFLSLSQKSFVSMRTETILQPPVIEWYLSILYLS